MIIQVRWRRTPGGRGRNAGQYQATVRSDWLQAKTGQSEAEAVGKVLLDRLNRLPSWPIRYVSVRWMK